MYCMEEKNHLELSEQIISVVFLHIILFRIQGRDTVSYRAKIWYCIKDDIRASPSSEIQPKY